MHTTHESTQTFPIRPAGIAAFAAFALSLCLGATPDALAAEGAKLERVEPSLVCMVNNRLFPNEQIPVQVGGNTYYGCCNMCKARLEASEEARVGTDPVSGKPVDKSSAVIGAASDGQVQYFESEANLAAFNSRSADSN